MTYVRVNHDIAKFLDTNYYADIIKKDDDTVTVLKLQLLCERFLSAYLEERIPSEQRHIFIDGSGRKAELVKHFNPKLRTAVALGMSVQLADALRFLNQIRNDFGHNFDAVLTQGDVNRYFELADKFEVNTDPPHVFQGAIAEKIVLADGKQFAATHSPRVGLVVATFVLMNRAGLWLVNDLQRRGQLKLG